MATILTSFLAIGIDEGTDGTVTKACGSERKIEKNDNNLIEYSVLRAMLLAFCCVEVDYYKKAGRFGQQRLPHKEHQLRIM